MDHPACCGTFAPSAATTSAHWSSTTFWCRKPSLTKQIAATISAPRMNFPQLMLLILAPPLGRWTRIPRILRRAASAGTVRQQPADGAEGAAMLGLHEHRAHCRHGAART